MTVHPVISRAAALAFVLLAAGALLLRHNPGAAADPGDVSAISAGGNDTCAVRDAALWCWGYSFGPHPVQMAGFESGVTAVSVGETHQCAIKNGGAWCRGGGAWGQLGDGSGQGSSVFVPVFGFASGVTDISAGGNHTCAVKDGGAFCWGIGGAGALGDGTGATSTVPVPVVGLDAGVTQVTAGTARSCAIQNGAAWCWGDNLRAGVGSPLIPNCYRYSPDGGQSWVPLCSNYQQSTCNGLIWQPYGYSGGDYSYPCAYAPVALSGLGSGVTSITVGYEQTCAVANGQTMCWGASSRGELGSAGLPDCGGGEGQCSFTPNPTDLGPGGTSISASYYTSCGIVGGAASCWGLNEYGELGEGTLDAFLSSTPLAVQGLSSGVTAVDVGDAHTCAIKDGEAWCWGLNNYGVLGSDAGMTCRTGTVFCSPSPAKVIFPGPETDFDNDGFLEASPTTQQGPANTNPAVDNCIGIQNVSQLNTDGNFINLHPTKSFDDTSQPYSDAAGDACDADDDNDGRSDADETGGVGCGGAITNPLKADTDADNFLDGAECALGTDPTSIASKPLESACGAAGDADGDGVLTRREVCYYNTDPNNANTDGDTCRDGKEVASINASNTVDVIDLQQVASEGGGYTLPGSAVKVDYDMTKNGAIDVIDLQFVAARAGPCP